jgi:hypothetical protein
MDRKGGPLATGFAALFSLAAPGIPPGPNSAAARVSVGRLGRSALQTLTLRLNELLFLADQLRAAATAAAESQKAPMLWSIRT